MNQSNKKLISLDINLNCYISSNELLGCGKEGDGLEAAAMALNEKTELRALYLKGKLAKIQGKSCNQLDSEANNPDPYSNIVCLDINNMEGVSNEVYMKAIKTFKDFNFRVSFVKIPEPRR
ncbi:Uncharacterized protein Fot_10882 [Forsythia ovata]|uniref:Uncharacterized protein n=1 Tax=Forsythia ovata TaxID=205694 RepID=A0ABD1WIC3_9LAMI